MSGFSSQDEVESDEEDWGQSLEEHVPSKSGLHAGLELGKAKGLCIFPCFCLVICNFTLSCSSVGEDYHWRENGNDVKRWKITVTFPFFPPIPIMTIVTCFLLIPCRHYGCLMQFVPGLWT